MANNWRQETCTRAGGRYVTLGEVIAQAIYSAYLPRPGTQGGAQARIRTELPVSTLGGGLRPGVRLESNSELEDVMRALLDDSAIRENPR